jgi:hypothetical protein
MLLTARFYSSSFVGVLFGPQQMLAFEGRPQRLCARTVYLITKPLVLQHAANQLSANGLWG